MTTTTTATTISELRDKSNKHFNEFFDPLNNLILEIKEVGVENDELKQKISQAEILASKLKSEFGIILNNLISDLDYEW